MRLSRHRDRTGQEERRRNDNRVDTLREKYGARFAPEVRGDMLLGTLKERIGLSRGASLNDVLRHYRIR